MTKNRKKYLKLQYYRKKYNLRQQDMAVLLGVKTSTYSHKECGISVFSFEETKLIQRTLNSRAQRHGDAQLTLDEIFLD